MFIEVHCLNKHLQLSTYFKFLPVSKLSTKILILINDLLIHISYLIN
jgi:hypothetical protein